MEVREFLEHHDPIEYISTNKNGIKDEIISECHIEEDMAAVPHNIFLPSKCEPVPNEDSSNANPSYAEVYERTEVTTINGALTFNATTHTLPWCGSYNDALNTWHINQNQALTVNLKIPGRNYWWGLCRLRKIVSYFTAHDLPLIFYWWAPEKLTAEIEKNIRHLQFAPPTEGCTSNRRFNFHIMTFRICMASIPLIRAALYQRMIWIFMVQYFGYRSKLGTQ